jgi:putative flippase GtrA
MLHMDYRVGISVSYIISIIFHFSANRYITFQSYDSSMMPQIFRYITMASFNYILTLVIVFISVEMLHLSPYVGAGIAVIFTVIIGFLLAKLWVFQTGRATHG